MINPDEFTDLLEETLVLEFGDSRNDAQRIIREYPDIVIQGIMIGRFSLRATALALQTEDSNKLQAELC